MTPTPKEEAGRSDLDNAIEASEATDGTAIGWTIVKINSDGSILCRDPRGTRRRFWFDGWDTVNEFPDVTESRREAILVKALKKIVKNQTHIGNAYSTAKHLAEAALRKVGEE